MTASMADLNPIRTLPDPSVYGKGDIMVIFGELFARGYVNGIVEEAEKAGMKIIYSTVGRRDKENQLRPLTDEEIAEKAGPIINIPLEAGFDMVPASDGQSPVDRLSGVKMSAWESVNLEEKHLEESKANGRDQFNGRVQSWVSEVKKHLEPGKNILFVHTMAGGVPRAKVIMPTMNKVFKGRGDRFIPSEVFWKSSMGKLCEMNFVEVTAETLRTLINETEDIRKDYEGNGNTVSYVAYGYHGTEVLVNTEYQWQTYTPYVQGWAKVELENIAKDFFSKQVKVCVFNCPEILTNSSSIFQGLEVSLYPLLGALEKEGADSDRVKEILQDCLSKLNEDKSLNDIMKYTAEYIQSSEIMAHSKYEQWPQHNSKEQMEKMISSSQEIISWHKDAKDLCNMILSEEVFKSCGDIMFKESGHPKSAVQWIGHDIIAKQIAAN